MATLDELRDRLTPQQQMAANMYVANEFAGKEKKTQDELAEEIGITRQGLHKWRTENLDFIRYQSALTEFKLESYRTLVDAKLISLIEKGPSNNGIPSIKAIELFYKLNGRLVDRSEVVTVASEATPRLTREEVTKGLDELNDMLK
jgi:transcriptional regulator with XRE-family HTH domain